MILNRLEYLAMNNPVRAAVQRRFEAPRLRRMGGEVPGGHVLEMGCGRGVGAEIILEQFGVERLDAFDLDPRMVELAGKRLSKFGSRVNLWTGDAERIQASDNTYDAVFDFGVIHHVPAWRGVLREVHRVLKPGGTFYSEEVLRSFILNPLIRRLFDHPLHDRFDEREFAEALEIVGLAPQNAARLRNWFVWIVARKPGDQGPTVTPADPSART